MQSGPGVSMVWEGLKVMKTGRVMLRGTKPMDSKPGTIHADFCIQVGRTLSMAATLWRVQRRRLACSSSLKSWWITRAVLRAGSMSEEKADLSALFIPFPLPPLSTGARLLQIHLFLRTSL
ncbi:unnamed protein product [Gulo gulo]|uniref:nucleoside-diphosphate kinase n=1 Tax=Gulo gulo TaxID=48420 RepID=A0A9X9Q9T8_GULGU|nr:unnamed protein product [Gulo gulo]